jgi:voltage-gated potassium channel Kch
MLSNLLLAWCLMAACVMVHATGVTAVLRRVPAQRGDARRYWPRVWLLVRLAGAIIAFHLLEICVWAAAYWWGEAMPDPASALYFSAVTYTTTGYGDMVLPQDWRLVGGVEALTGILMCGWSTGFFFALVSRLDESRAREVR